MLPQRGGGANEGEEGGDDSRMPARTGSQAVMAGAAAGMAGAYSAGGGTTGRAGA